MRQPDARRGCGAVGPSQCLPSLWVAIGHSSTGAMASAAGREPPPNLCGGAALHAPRSRPPLPPPLPPPFPPPHPPPPSGFALRRGAPPPPPRRRAVPSHASLLRGRPLAVASPLEEPQPPRPLGWCLHTGASWRRPGRDGEALVWLHWHAQSLPTRRGRRPRIRPPSSHHRGQPLQLPAVYDRPHRQLRRWWSIALALAATAMVLVDMLVGGRPRAEPSEPVTAASVAAAHRWRLL